MPRVFCGWLNANNRPAFDWGWHGLLAYGCQSCVAVIHPGKVQVKFARSNYPHDRKDNCYQVTLASADTMGSIIVWDCVSGSQKAMFADQNKIIGDMEWVPWQDTGKDYLAVLHSSSTFVLWDAESGTKVWKKVYTDSFVSFSFDPFNCSSAAFVSQNGNIMLINDFSLSSTPQSNGYQHFRMSNRVSDGGQAGALTPTSTDDVTRKSLAEKFIRKPFMTVLAAASSVASEKLATKSEEPTSFPHSPDECLQAIYHPAVQHRLLLVYAKEVLFLDLHSLQAVAHVVLDKNYSPLIRVIPCSQRDAVYFIQENGCVTLRIRKTRPGSGSGTPNLNPERQQLDAKTKRMSALETYYDHVCSSESLRVTKNYRVLSAVLNPVTQRHVAILMSSGKVFLHDLECSGSVVDTSTLPLLEIINQDKEFSFSPIKKLKFVLSGMYSSVGQTPVVVRACAVTLKPHRNYMAVGTSDGQIQLLELVSGEIEKDFSVHSCAVKCMEWGHNTQIISAGSTQTLSTSTVVRNELISTDIVTGVSKFIRPECDEFPIEMIRVSHYNCFLAISFRDQPLEIWDLSSLKCLRKMSKTCPVIVDMAWSRKHHQAKILRSTSSSLEENEIDILQSSQSKSQTVYRENLVVLDNDNHLYHVVVKGMHVRDGKRVNTQWQTNSLVTSMVWKDDYLVFGDSEGKLQVWDLTGKDSKVSASQRGGIKRLQFSHNPGDYTLIAMHSDGVTTWNISKFACMHQLVSTRDLPISIQVVDVDLIGEENLPVVLTSDGCVRVYDRNLMQLNQSIPDRALRGMFCPSILPPSVAWFMRAILCDRAVQTSLAGDQQFEMSTALTNSKITEHEQKLIDDHIKSLEGSAVFKGRTGGIARTGFEATRACFKNFKKEEMHRCAVFDSRRATSEQIASQIERLILLGQLDEATQLLLETDSSGSDYLAHSLKACLISVVSHSTDDYLSTIKMVATNLIAGGQLSEGVQLLCLIGKFTDACRYLQSSNEWEKAAWLAKVSLGELECGDLLKKWADHMCTAQISKKSNSILVLLGLRHFEKVLEMLTSIRHFSTAALLLQALVQHGLFDESTLVNTRLKEVILTEYARELEAVGLLKPAIYYCDLVGEKGAALKKEINLLTED